jgi:phosphoesterase RecJ-like protein
LYETEDIAALKEHLALPRRIVIFTHRNPDGDAMGSSLALYNFLIEQNHKVKVILPSEYPDNFAWMPGAEECLVYDIDPEGTTEEIKKGELFFCLDFNSLERIDKMAKVIEECDVPIIMIDHHRDPEPFMDIMFSDPSASSTCEMIYEIISKAGWSKLINKSMLDCLYTGILTDTGSFRHGTTARVYEIVAELKRRGLDDYMINDRIFNSSTEKTLRLLGHSLYNRMEVLPELSSAIIHLTKEDYKTFNIIRGDTEGIVNYLLTIKGIQLAAFITEQPRIVKISLRSKYDINVQKLAREHFNGGGHKNAAGGYTFESLENALNRLKKAIPHYIRPQTNKTNK